MEQVQYNLLFRWFIGLSMDDTVWVPTVFTKNRERLIKHDAVIEFFNEVVGIAEKKCWLSGEHFSVDGTLIQAWAGHEALCATTMIRTPKTEGASRARRVAMRRMNRRATRIRGCIVKAKRQASYATWDTR